MADEQDKDTQPANQDQPARAVLFELENVAIDGRRVAYEVLSKVLKEHNITLTPALFSRHCLDSAPAAYVPKLLAALHKSQPEPDKLVDAFEEKHVAALTGSKAQAGAALKKLLKNLFDRGTLVGALTELAATDASNRLEKMGLPYSVKVQQIASDEKSAPTADAWLKMAKAVGASPSACIAIVTGADSAKAAVSAGMRCFVVTDEFTSFQDFGGADCVVDVLDEAAVTAILELLDATV